MKNHLIQKHLQELHLERAHHFVLEAEKIQARPLVGDVCFVLTAPSPIFALYSGIMQMIHMLKKPFAHVKYPTILP